MDILLPFILHTAYKSIVLSSNTADNSISFNSRIKTFIVHIPTSYLVVQRMIIKFEQILKFPSFYKEIDGDSNQKYQK